MILLDLVFDATDWLPTWLLAILTLAVMGGGLLAICAVIKIIADTTGAPDWLVLAVAQFAGAVWGWISQVPLVARLL